MNKSYKKTFNLTIFLAFLLNSALFAADANLSNAESGSVASTLMGDLDLNKIPHEWLSVISGQSIAEPARTSYGWISVTDGRMVTAFSENGGVLWQKAISSKPENLFAASSEDFLAVVLKNEQIAFLNPSGILLWTSKIGFKPIFAPLYGRDGRIFVFGKEGAACFGINGIRKWSIKIAALNDALAPTELNDGSLMLFAQELEDGKTVGVRVSPFGEQIERVVFSGQITAAFRAANGILLAFNDGTFGLCAVSEESDSLVSKWILKDLNLNASAKFFDIDSDSLSAVAVPSNNGTKIHIVNTQAARLIRSFDIPEINTINYITYNSDRIFIADKNCALIYSNTARRMRKIIFPKEFGASPNDYVLYGSNGVAVFVLNSWTIMGWKILQNSGGENFQKKSLAYKNFYERQPFNNKSLEAASTDSRKNALLKGDYSASEKKFWKDADFTMNEYFAEKMAVGQNKSYELAEESPYFTFSEKNAVISMLGLFGTRDSTNTLARVLNTESDASVLRIALKSVQDCGYDPNGFLMDAIELILKNSDPRQEILIADCCEALYSICRFMGRPAFFKKGRSILSNLFMPQYSKSAKENARKVYKKLAEIEL